MWCIRKLKVYFVCFYVFGLTTYIPLNKNHRKMLEVVSVFVRLVHTSILLGVYILFFINHIEKLQSNDFTEIFENVMYLCGNIIASIVLYENITARYSANDICAHFASVVQRMDRNLQIKIQINKFQRMFVQKVVTKFLAVSFALLIRASTGSENVKLTIRLEGNLYEISRFGLYIVLFYVVFYIDLIVIALRSINDQLEHHFYASRRYTRTSTMLYHLKCIHYNLWKISQIINQNYGLLTAILLLQYFAIFVFAIFLMLTSRSIENIRK